MKKSELKSIIQYVLTEMKESTEPSIGGSYNDQQTNVEPDDITQLERDPLTDPKLTGKNPIKELSNNYIVTLNRDSAIHISNTVGQIVFEALNAIKILGGSNGPQAKEVTYAIERIQKLRKDVSDELVKHAVDQSNGP